MDNRLASHLAPAHLAGSAESYDTFCFFCQISNSTKKKDEFAFFCFFTFKSAQTFTSLRVPTDACLATGWKRLLLSDGPRQAINGCTLYSFAYANNFQTHDLAAYWDGSITTLLLLLAMMATVALFVCSLLLLIGAAICYIPRKCVSPRGTRLVVIDPPSDVQSFVISRATSRNTAATKSTSGSPNSYGIDSAPVSANNSRSRSKSAMRAFSRIRTGKSSPQCRRCRLWISRRTMKI